MRKTKIICTLGPSTDSPEILQAMMENGMDVARFNFSHGSHDEHKRRLEELKALRKKLNLPVAALLDTKGPETVSYTHLDVYKRQTRDAVDSYFENEVGKFLFIDTAGMRKKAKVSDQIEDVYKRQLYSKETYFYYSY